MQYELTPDMLYLLDMDGTLYNDNVLFDGVREFLDYINSHSGRYMFITNNSSKSSDDYVKKLASMGIKSSKNDFFTSTDAVIIYLKNNYDKKKIYCVGTQSFKKQLSEHNISICDAVEKAEVVLVAYDTELTYQKLYDASYLLSKGLDFVATNPDRGCPVPFGLVPDCGAICEALYFATGKRPKYIGKPEPEMIYSAMDMCGYSKDNTVVVGDRLYTDIAAGNNAGVKTVLVLSGETTEEILEKSNIKPTMIEYNISEILKKWKASQSYN